MSFANDYDEVMKAVYMYHPFLPGKDSIMDSLSPWQFFRVKIKSASSRLFNRHNHFIGSKSRASIHS